MNISRIRFVSSNFSQLQGLRLLPIGLLLIFLGVDSWGWLDWLPGKPAGPDGIGNAWAFAAWLLALLAAVIAVARYRERYGTVLQFDRTTRNRLLSLSAIMFGLCVAVDWTRTLPLLLAPLVVSLSLIVVVVSDGWLRSHYLIGAIAWLALSWPSLSAANPRVLTLSHYFVLGGFTLIVCGVGDHLLLSRTFPRSTLTMVKGDIGGSDKVI